MGYNLQHGKDLNFEKGRCGFLRNFVPKGKPANNYDNTHRGLGYITPTPLATVQFEDNKLIPSHSASSSEWDSDVSVGTVFKELTVNMTSSSQLEPAEATDGETMGSAIRSPMGKAIRTARTTYRRQGDAGQLG